MAEIVKVSSKTVPKLTAGAIAAMLKENDVVEVQAIGAGAVNQAVKAIAIAAMFFAEDKKELVCKPAFSSITINDTEKTAISMFVKLI